MKFLSDSQLILASLACSALLGFAPARADESDAAQANNPLANMKAFNMHNYYIGELTETDEDANQFWFRYAQPISVGESSWLLRASLPVNTFPTKADGGNETGLGDMNLFASYLLEMDNPAVSFGVGPQLTAPTATEDALGSEQWSAGLVNVMFDGRSPKVQYGYLLSWQHSFTDEDARADVNVGAFQPFTFYQLGGGHYLRGSPVWVYDFESDSYTVPLGLGYGRAMKKGSTVYNLFVEPQYSIFDDGPGFPEWQVFVGLNLQFLGN